VPLSFRPSLSAAFPIVFSRSVCAVRGYLPLPGHHVDGGSLAEILFGRKAMRWLRL
jgi:hypothetical protein